MIQTPLPKTLLSVLTTLALALGGASSGGENWERFRGNNGSGISHSGSIPSEWTKADVAWSAELPGAGNSSPVIWADHLYVTAADEDAGLRYLICFDKKRGVELWRANSEFQVYKKHNNNSFASSTPAADKDHVYVLWHSKQQTVLQAFRHDGQQAWEHDLGPYQHGQGGATSPIVAGDSVVVAHDHKNDSFLVALDRNTGKPRWQIPREGKRACYSTPCVRTTDGGELEVVFSHCYEGVIGVDAVSGKRRWHFDPFGRSSQRALTSPIVAGNLVIAGSGAAGGERQIVAIELTDTGGESTPREAYRVTRQSTHVPTPLALGDRLYLWNDGGIATCCDLADGEILWQKRVGGKYFASPIAIGDRLFSIDTEGEVVVIAAEDKFRAIARTPLQEGSRATLATSDGVLYARTHTHLHAIAGPRP